MSLKTKFQYALRERSFVFLYLLVAVVYDISRLLNHWSWSFLFTECLPKLCALLDTLKLSMFSFLTKSNEEKIEALAIRMDEDRVIIDQNKLSEREKVILGDLIIIYIYVLENLIKKK